MDRNESKASPGYVSKDGKRTFTIIACILGAAFLTAQILVPFIAMIASIPVMGLMSGFKIQSNLIDRATCWNGEIWYVNQILSIASGEGLSCECYLHSFAPGKDKNNRILVQNVANPWLLPDSDKLWVISARSVGFLRDGEFVFLDVSETLGDISRPFLYGGKPAVIEERSGRLRIRILRDGVWEKGETFELGRNNIEELLIQNIQVLSISDRLCFFYKRGDTLYFRDTIPGKEEDWNAWQPVAKVNRWTSFSCGGAPAVLYHESRISPCRCVKAAKLSNGLWKEYYSKRMSSVLDLGACGLAGKGTSILLLSPFSSDFHAIEVDGSAEKSDILYGEKSPLPKGLFLMMGLSQGGLFLFTLIIAFILTLLMRKYRVTTIGSGNNMTARFAPLSKRALAQIVDIILPGTPVVAVNVFFFNNFENMMNPLDFLKLFGLMMGSSIWALIFFFIYGFTEGKWGITPGKQLFGIKVVGLDLKPCGFGRALLRNMLRIVDCFFHYLVGMTMVAFTENWQRLGDYVARTIVIETERDRNRTS